MSAEPIHAGRDFFAPTFEIRLKGQNLGREVIRDILDVSYSDDLESLDSFEFTLNDWDPVRRAPKYSNPFDENGRPLKDSEGNWTVPSFEPGARVELRMGYQGSETPLMMEGKIVSLSPSFPASGTPTLKVRALNLLYTLLRSQQPIVYEQMTVSEIAEDIAERLQVDHEIPGGDDEEVMEYVLVKEPPILFLLHRARLRGYDLYVTIDDEAETSKLFFGPKPSSGNVYELEWGKSLASFTPTLKTKGQVWSVTVRGWNPTASGDERSIVGEATWKDLGFEHPDANLVREIESSLAQSHREEIDEVVRTEEEARQRARGILQSIGRGLITGRGSTVGFPQLRAGRRIELKGLGTRYSGTYLVRDTTHAMGSGGYTTQFTAEMEVFSG